MNNIKHAKNVSTWNQVPLARSLLASSFLFKVSKLCQRWPNFEQVACLSCQNMSTWNQAHLERSMLDSTHFCFWWPSPAGTFLARMQFPVHKLLSYIMSQTLNRSHVSHAKDISTWNQGALNVPCWYLTALNWPSPACPSSDQLSLCSKAKHQTRHA